MPKSQDIHQALSRVHDQPSFFKALLADTLDWPVGDAKQIEDIAYGWSAQDLNASGLDRNLVEGSIWQLQPAAKDQPWGIFVLEFKSEDSLSPRRGMAGVLRKVLRGLVNSRRKDPKLPSWKREHLLFICTHKWSHFRFAYFRSKAEEPRSAKLTTFGWAPGTSPRTVCEFNLPALLWPDDTADGERWVPAWAKAFDKEPLTRDFFKRFDNALDAIKTDLQKEMGLSSAEAYTQSQLLLERLLFLYFLQNRGWLDQKRDYLKAALANHKKPGWFSYYRDFLDKLFWTLATAPGGAGRFPGIPFLNGGLFDDDEFLQPAEMRKTTPPLKVRNQTMQYVFDELLEAFNFTVTEDTPLNQEVAVDPEMLGKVFESIVLHAEAADPDAVAPDKRKATGSYYTPRIVVHFICREALYQYLLNHLPGDGWGPKLKALLSFDLSDGLDEEEKGLLRKTITPDQARKVLDLVVPLKCCDPAVGSGAFPVGLMQELVNLRRLLETVLNGYRDPVLGPQGSTWLHESKTHIVENCLFGVDIQQQAIEICRLRLWLSLVVDYDLGLDPFEAEHQQFMEAIGHISQLPNLEMNFHRGDSLHDHISGVPVVILPDRASRHAAEFTAIAKLGAELHKAKKAERKKKLRLDILEKRLALSRTIVEEELRELRTRDSALNGLFGLEESNAEKRKRNEREIEHLETAIAKVEEDRKELEKLRRRDADSQFYPKLRKLEGADFDSPFNFAWSIDFPGVFGSKDDGFDIVVGNPPFVTARNPDKRELWRGRWPRVCVSTYQLVSPFFELGFSLLRPVGQLGFIVSNAFAKRSFGQALVELFFSGVFLQKVIDCSGLLFPGHGTPTCLVFGAQQAPKVTLPIRMAAILPGGGDLRTPPEESPLWKTLATHHDEEGYEDSRVVVANRLRSELNRWPWSFDSTVTSTLEILESSGVRLGARATSFGSMFDTHKDDVYMVSADLARRAGITSNVLAAVAVGDQIRNWGVLDPGLVIKPYNSDWTLLAENDQPVFLYLRRFRKTLGSRATFGGQTYKQAGEAWYRYHQMSVPKLMSKDAIVYPEIATHGHFVVRPAEVIFPQTAPLFIPSRDGQLWLLLGAVNSSTALFLLKQYCFNKGAGSEEHRDRFEYAAAKMQQLTLPKALDEKGPATRALEHLSKLASQTAASASAFRFKDVFADDTRMPGDADSLRARLSELRVKRDVATAQMIAAQEEIDWLVYAGYGLLAENDLALRVDLDPEPLERNQRPFHLWERAKGDYDKAGRLIPKGWNGGRRRLWEARLAVIRDNEHIRRIEQPVYKRRWDEQWKVGNQWRCGEIAYTAEFIDAFEWWLKEKAEWWLEHKKAGGPVEIGEWAHALWKDARIQAAWPVAAEQHAFLEHEKARERAEEEGEPVPPAPKPSPTFSAFAREFKRIIEEETVPEGFPFGTPYEELEKKLRKDVPPKLKKVRGKLNVPRERFHSVGRGQYKWAGLQFRN